MPPVSEQEVYRRRFMSAAHVLVFSIAALAVIGMALHFANFRRFNTQFLVGMGLWIVGSAAWIYFTIIKKAARVKGSLPKPPTS